jgi:hypothetical protein
VKVFAAGGELPVHGKGPSSLDEKCETYPDDKKVVFKPFSLLLPEPVHEEAVLHMTHEHAKRKACADPYGPESGEESENEQHRSQGLDTHKSDDRPVRETHPCKSLKGLGESRAPEPSQNLLGTMGKHDNSQAKPYEELGRAVVCPQKFL